jgi:hypothetical protein
VSRSTRDDEKRAGQAKGSWPELVMVIVSCARARVAVSGRAFKQASGWAFQG